MGKKKETYNEKPRTMSYEDFLSSGSAGCAMLSWEGSDYGSLELGGSCDNDCLFCFQEEEVINSRKVCDPSKQIEELAREYDKIVFCELEPTLNPKLPGLIRAVKDQKKRAFLATNGKRLKDPEYARLLVDSGIDSFNLSIHGSDQIIHDLLTRLGGSFNDSIQGLKNLLAIKNPHGTGPMDKGRFEIMINYVLTKANIKSLRSSLLFFSELSSRARVDRINFSAIVPRGKGDENYEMLMPRYEDILQEFDKVAKLYSDESQKTRLPKVTLSGLPFCSYNHHRKNLNLSAVPMIMFGEDEFLDLKQKQPFCRSCIFDKQCKGIWKKHLDCYPKENYSPVE